MDIIEMARELGSAIQEDERYLNYRLAQQKNDEDAGLQQMIGEFNLKRVALNQEMQNSERDQEKLQKLDGEIKALYREIFANENMIAYNNARTEMESLTKFINQIIAGSVNGEDPRSIEPNQGCEGNCGGCAGCS